MLLNDVMSLLFDDLFPSVLRTKQYGVNYDGCCLHLSHNRGHLVEAVAIPSMTSISILVAFLRILTTATTIYQS